MLMLWTKVLLALTRDSYNAELLITLWNCALSCNWLHDTRV
jgi:hypothetical protein